MSIFRSHHPYGTVNNGHEDHPKEKKKPHIKKPLNAFMLFMKDMRAKVVAECTLKESAAINQILGRKVSVSRWMMLIPWLGHTLSQPLARAEMT